MEIIALKSQMHGYTIDNEFQGVFPLPANFPVLKLVNKNIIIEAGIKKNGISSSRENYPFFTSFEVNKNYLKIKIFHLVQK